MLGDIAVGRRGGTTKAARPSRGRFLLHTLLAGIAGAWALIALVGVVLTTLNAARQEKTDFFLVLDGTLQWQEGLPLYEPRRVVVEETGTRPAHPNLNHPVTVPLLAPLTLLAPPIAFLVWNAIGLAAFLAAVALALRATRLRLTPITRIVAISAVIACPGLIYGLQLGQVGLLLAAPIVGAWLLLRGAGRLDERWRLLAAGALLGVLVALKPFLLPVLTIFLPRRKWPGLVAAAAGGGLISLLALPLVGWGAYPDWLRALGSIDWYDHGLNVSLTGFLHRVVPVSLPAPVGWGLQLLAVALGALAVLRARDDRTPAGVDRLVGLLLVLSVLGSPLGWLYYTPLLIPAIVPALAAWPGLPASRRRFLAVPALLLWTPHILVPLLPDTLLGDLTVRATPTYGLLLLLAYLATAERAPLRGAGPVPAARTVEQAGHAAA